MAAWFGGVVGGVIGALVLIVVLVVWLMKRRAKIEIMKEAEEVQLGKLAAPSILPNGGRHPAGTTVVIVPTLNAGVYYRIGSPTDVHQVQFSRLDGQNITLGTPDTCGVPGGDPAAPHEPGKFIVQAFCYAPGREDSDIVTAMIEIAPPDGDVFFSHPPGAYAAPFALALWHPTGRPVFYTTDGSDPWDYGLPYCPAEGGGGGLWVDGTCEVRAAVQGSRVPSAVRRYVVNGQLAPPRLLVSGEVRPSPRDVFDAPRHGDEHPPIVIRQRERVGFSAGEGATVMYSAEPFSAGWSRRYLALHNDTPATVFSAPVALTQGTWVVRAIAVKTGHADSAVATLRVVCAPNPPTIQHPVRLTPPYKLRLKAENPVTYRVLRVPEGGGDDVADDDGAVVSAEVDVPTPHTVLLHEAGTFRLECCAVDNATCVRSEDVSVDFEVEAARGAAPREPTVDPANGRYVLTGDSFPFIVNTKQRGALVRLEVNGEAVPCTPGEEVHVKAFGVVKVTATAVDAADPTLVSAATTQVYRIAPPPPRLSPAGSGSYGVGFSAHLAPPVRPSWAGMAVGYTIERWLDGAAPEKEAVEGRKAAVQLPMTMPGRYRVSAHCTVDGAVSEAVEGFYEVQAPVAASQASPRDFAAPLAGPIPAPVFYPTDQRHYAPELEVFLQSVDGVVTHYAVNDPGMEARQEAVPNAPVLLTREGHCKPDGTVVVYAMCASATNPRAVSPVVSKVYKLLSPPRPPPPKLTCHARQMVLELHVPPEDGVAVLYTLDGSAPLMEEDGSTHLLPPSHTVAIPDKGTTEVKAIAVDRTGKRFPSRVVSKVFVEGAPYLALGTGTAAATPVRAAADAAALRPPDFIAHPRTVAIVAASKNPADVVRYTLDGTPPGAASPLLPAHGLQIALHAQTAPVTLRVVAFDCTNTVHSEEVSQAFVHVQGGVHPGPPPPEPAAPPAPEPQPPAPVDAAPTTADTSTSPIAPPLPAAAPPPQPPRQQPAGAAIVGAGASADSFSRGYEAARRRAREKRQADAQRRLG
eukprot:TRINITY_DN22469_c0_g1_i1.p1 TRINITY_DN22469_c0_g1~~TRINITY_DN22469_c0_g1_i1.p1  ORF type:complete len:1043 (+),score=328.33 TRINITY_DN22469_c0_g1_i1:45-3131(+)